MAMIVRSVRLAADADAVWDVVGDFAGVDSWVPGASRPVLRSPALAMAGAAGGGVATLEPAVPGTERVFGPGTRTELVHRLTARDDRARRLMYAVEATPFPVVDHRASIIVRPLGRGCEVVWTAAFRADAEIVDALEVALGDHVFEPALGALEARFGAA